MPSSPQAERCVVPKYPYFGGSCLHTIPSNKKNVVQNYVYTNGRLFEFSIRSCDILVWRITVDSELLQFSAVKLYCSVKTMKYSLFWTQPRKRVSVFCLIVIIFLNAWRSWGFFNPWHSIIIDLDVCLDNTLRRFGNE